jgi:Tol biopolymer transport system component
MQPFAVPLPSRKATIAASRTWRTNEEIAMTAPPSVKPDRLDSWKEIAAYLNRDVTTVQRWEKREGMPVHRHLHDRMGSVYAYQAELDAWTRSRNSPAAPVVEQVANPVSSQAANEIPPPAEKPPVPRKRLILPLVLITVLALAAFFWLQRTERLWRNPIANARYQTITGFDGVAQAAAISRDGQFIAFLSDHDGPADVWVTQVGSGQFHNLTRGSVPDLVNPSLRALDFSPDGAFVTFWTRRRSTAGKEDIGVWAVPTLGGQPSPYLEGAAEFDWSPNGAQLAYHTPGPGDPLFVSTGGPPVQGRLVFTAPAGLHSHFPLWARDGSFLYFVQGELPDKLDIWRVPQAGGTPERITNQNGLVGYPAFLDRRTLIYLATDPDGSGPWLYSVDVEHRVPHRLTAGPDRYTSLAVTADGKRVAATLASPKTTLWRLPITEAPNPTPKRISLTTTGGSSPRLGPNYLLYVSATATSESIWKLVDGAGTELWKGERARILGGPAISPDGKNIAFSVQQQGQSLLYVLQADGTNVRMVNDSLHLEGSPAWSPDGQSITTSSDDHGIPHLFRVPLDGRPPVLLVHEYAVDPTWSPDGKFVLYSGPDIGTTFAIHAFGSPVHPVPAMTLTRGARRVAFLPDGHTLLLLRGEMEHKDLWFVDLQTGLERQLTNLASEFNIRDFDISPDGREVVLERMQERSDVVLLDLGQK